MSLSAALMYEVIRVVIDKGLGFRPTCLRQIDDLVNSVVKENHTLLLKESRAVVAALDSFRELGERLAEEAQMRGDLLISEDDKVSAENRCGLIFICRPPRRGEFGGDP